MRLSSGTRLGPYEVVAPLGAGGMGEVYRARDTRLDRTVALKVLAPDLAADQEFRSRFDREARTISSLSHPHICVLHDVGHQDGIDYLVFEHLEGHTLEQTLRTHGSGLKPAEALRVAIEIADALDAAHRHGVVHRDLKPGNVMLTPSGAKLLDFGLAKRQLGTGAALSMLATHPVSGTAQGTIIGTLQYMAPEQIQGRETDERTDLFALGQIIYEMVTGRKAFEGQTQASVMARILEIDPAPISTLAAASPAALDRVVRRCLAKDPEERWQNARDVLLELRWIRDAGATEGAARPARDASRWRSWLPWTVVALAVAAGAWAWLSRPAPAASARRVVRFDIAFPSDMSLEDWRGGPTLSADGRAVVVPVARDGRGLLALRRLDDSSVILLPGTEGGSSPFFSPSGRSLAFIARNRLRRIEIAGGPAVTIADAPAGIVFGRGTWNRDGVLLVGTRGAVSGVLRVPESGGRPVPATTLDAARGDNTHRTPLFLPDGRSFLFTVLGREPGIYVGSLDSALTRRVLSDTTAAFYVDPGFLVFQRGRAVLAMPFDVRRLEASGTPFPIADAVFPYQYFGSDGGDLAYRFDGGITAQLAWYSRDGRRLATVGEPGPDRQIALSPSGRRVALQRGDAVSGGVAEADLWVLDFATGVLSRMTSDPGLDADPCWSPDERRVAFTTNRTGTRAIFVKDLATGRETPLVEFAKPAVLDEWTPDGRFAVFRSLGASLGMGSIYVLPLTGDDRTPRALTETATIVDQSHVSPDGGWIAFNSDESGTWEVYVAAFPEFGNRRQVSTSGGMQPMWRRDGKELFYLTPQGQIMSIDVQGGGSSGTIDIATPKPLLRTSLNPSVQLGEYAVSPDGQRFLVLEPVGDRTQSISVLLNWPGKGQ